MTALRFPAIRARQSDGHIVVSFPARASDLQQIASIDRVARDAQGELSGFQRPQIAAHIREIKDYLDRPEAILPNPIVVAFTSRVEIENEQDDGRCTVVVDVSEGPPGLVVDGQQRLTALSQLEEKDFQVFVSAVVCADEAELRRQFVLINNTRPLPKSLIYELLPTVDGLPRRFAGRSLAADLTAQLNYDKTSSLVGMVHQHTNPAGILSDTAIQRVIINSASDGILREFGNTKKGRAASLKLLSDYFQAVQEVFAADWKDKTPTTSRLVGGAGLVAMGYVMEELALTDDARSVDDFKAGLRCLVGRTHWTSGAWDFGGGDVRQWKVIQNVNRDIMTLAQYLIGIVRADIRARRAAPVEDLPLMNAGPAS
jgi:DGQHR domain-containing protein